MTDDYLARVEATLEVIRVHGLRSFSWFNQEEAVLSPALARRLPIAMQRDHFREVLAARLYGSFYCHGFATPSEGEPPAPRLLSAREALGRALAAANRGVGYEDQGWAMRSRGDAVVVHKGGLTLRVERKDFAARAAPGSGRLARFGLRMPKESRTLSPGYYVALGDEPLPADEPLVRFYWNLREDGAVAFLRAATESLNEARLPFRLKLVDHPARFTRRDAAVLYAPKRGYGRVRESLESLYPVVERYLKDGGPAFTKPLAFGLGLAEDPPAGASFGLQRCGILAEGILEAHERRRRRPCDRLDIVVRRFEVGGISLRRPYLNSGSPDGYVFEVSRRRSRQASPARLRPPHAADPRQDFRATALAIGRLLARRAIWSGGRCNWMGMDVHGSAETLESAGSLAYKALGPTVFGGTSGIAVFLAELSASGSDATVRRTAVGAMEQALSAAPAVRDAGRLGLYDGVTGIALAAAWVGRLLGEDRLSDGARELVNAMPPGGPVSVEADLLRGRAGIVAGLLTLHALWREESLLEAATRCGDALLASAERNENVLSWRSVGVPGQRPLTGLSHGAAGIAYALLELFRAGGASRFREAAESAFDFERRWFDRGRANWPDFRGVPAKRRFLDHAVSFPVAWCHGAAGIALSRLRACAILEDPRYREEALTALETTASSTTGALRSEVGNFSLCHGLAGNAAVLAHGARVLPADFAKGGALAEEAAMACVARRSESGSGWRFGALGDRSPSLMLGLAGVGHLCLGLSEPATPSLLLLEPERIRQRLDPRVQTGAPAA